MKNLVAIVGRPNVGKSTLFNRLVRKKSAIVDPIEGVTRDCKYETIVWENNSFHLIDTGGIVFNQQVNFAKEIFEQVNFAIEKADLILFVVDAKVSLTDIDLKIAKILHKKNGKIIPVVNKVDNDKDGFEIYKFLSLGFGDSISISASHGKNIRLLLNTIIENLPFENIKEEELIEEIKVAIIGRPNVGKSSLINKLTQKQISIVSTISGTTRDSIYAKIKYFGKAINFIDTAGLRKKNKINANLDYYSSLRSLQAIKEADLTLLILDATESFATQDKKIAAFACKNCKNILLIINKWDLIEKNTHTVKKFNEELKYNFPFLANNQRLYISALTGQRTNIILKKIIELHDISSKRIQTSKMNLFLEQALKEYSPFSTSGKQLKIYYCTQENINPPTFIFFCNDTKLLTANYKKYLLNKVKKNFGFEEVFVKIIFKGKEKK